MLKFTYRLEMLSSIIISPRASKGWYKALDEFSFKDIPDQTEYLDRSRLKVIYPFYQYGEYTTYSPKDADYYIPGSSIKGALLDRYTMPGSCMVDDVSVDNSSIVLRNLYKVMYLKNDMVPEFDVFFGNVGIEMVKSGTSLTGTLYMSGLEAEKMLKKAETSTKNKMRQMQEYLSSLNAKDFDLLQEVKQNLSELMGVRGLILLGGFKGLLHSLELNHDTQQNMPQAIREIHSAVFIEPDLNKKRLPHGFAKMEFI